MTWNGGVRDVKGGVPPTLEVAHAKTSRCKMLETNNVSESGKNEEGAGGRAGKTCGRKQKKTDEKKAFCQGNARRDEAIILGAGNCLKNLG